jgi:putative Mn2+ efflux pump MntP
MSWITLLGIAVGLAMDAFAVATATGLALRTVTPRHVFRLAFHFGLFQFLMPVIGWAAGSTFSQFIGDYDHWVAFGLLAFVGGKMLWEAFTDHEAEASGDPTRGLMLVTLSVATSIDALAVGLSMAMLGVAIWLPSVVIGLVAGGLTTVGLLLGNRLGARCGFWAEVTGGCVLLAIGLRILYTHLVG